MTTLNELATAIYKHLKRFEADPVINAPDPKYRTRPYYQVNCCRAGRYVHVSYVTYQGGINLTRDEAERYLAWLNEGNIGRHYEMSR